MVWVSSTDINLGLSLPPGQIDLVFISLPSDSSKSSIASSKLSTSSVLATCSSLARLTGRGGTDTGQGRVTLGPSTSGLWLEVPLASREEHLALPSTHRGHSRSLRQ